MFKVTQGTFTRKVTIKVPVDGGTEKQDFKVTFQTMPASAARELKSGEEIEKWLHDAVLRIDDLVDEDGETLDWNDAVAAQFWDLPYVFDPILDTYKAAMVEARTKN